MRPHQRFETTTIYVTHDQVEAITLGARIAVLNQGRLQQVGSPEDLYDPPATCPPGASSAHPPRTSSWAGISSRGGRDRW